MTINWSKTATDREAAEVLAPHVLRHLQRINGRWTWVEGSPKYRPTRSLHCVVEEILAEIAEVGGLLDSDTRWDRTRHRLTTTHGLAQIRRTMERFLDFGI